MSLFIVAIPASADISDSGNLIIGGQGVIGGTMTVQGSAFSVGGATFSVTGSTVNLNIYALGISTNGIQWADGSVSTTATAGLPSNVMLTTSTDTVSGAKTFLSSVTVSGGLWVTTATYACRGLRCVIASSNTTGSTPIEFTNISTGTDHTLVFVGSVTTTGYFWLRCHNVASSYSWGGYRMQQAGNAPDSSGCDPTHADISSCNDPPNAGFPVNGSAHFTINTVGFSWTFQATSYDASVSNGSSITGGGQNVSSGCRASSPTDIEFGTTGGFTGKVWIEDALSP